MPAQNIDNLVLEPGFKISIFAENLSSPRQIAQGKNGTIFVGERTGQIIALSDTDQNGQADEKKIIAEGLEYSTGVSIFNGDLYFSEISKIWKIENIEESKDSIKCIMKYLSKDMEENYPGNLDCTVTYELNNNNELLIDFGATSDKDTIVNMTNHNYWNFHGHRDGYQNNEDHVVCINSKSICETDNDCHIYLKKLKKLNYKYIIDNLYNIDYDNTINYYKLILTSC